MENGGTGGSQVWLLSCLNACYNPYKFKGNPNILRSYMVGHCRSLPILLILKGEGFESKYFASSENNGLL